MYGKAVNEAMLLLRKRRWQVSTSIKLRHVVSHNQMNVRLDNLYNAQERLKMAVPKKSNKTDDKPDFKGFINIDIPQDRKIECRKFIQQQEECTLLVEQAIASGYKLSMTKNNKTDSHIASMQCNDAKSKNAGYVLSAHASHWYDALAVLMWKHFIFLEQNWHVEVTHDLDDIG